MVPDCSKEIGEQTSDVPAFVPLSSAENSPAYSKFSAFTQDNAEKHRIHHGDIPGSVLANPGKAARSGETAQEDEPAKRNTQDLEALYPVSSGPAYTVFTPRQRTFIVYMVACASFFSPLSANIYFPALTSLSKDLHVSNSLINVSLTSYMIFQGLAPTVFGDLADMTGRRPTLILGFIIYVGANVGLALQKNYAALLVLRCLQSTGSSGTVALGNGIVADIASSGERGGFMGEFGFWPLERHDANLK